MIEKFLEFLCVEALLDAIGGWLDTKVTTFTIQPVTNGEEERKDYLKRWYLLRLNDETKAKYPKWVKAFDFVRREFGIELYLHRMSDDDQDRHLHDHPWDFCAILLSGGYREMVPSTGTQGAYLEERMEVVYEAPAIHTKNRHDFHSVKLHRDEEGEKIPNWSLIIRGRKKKDWGFSTEDGWKGHAQYLDELYGQGTWEREPHYYDQEVTNEQ